MSPRYGAGKIELPEDAPPSSRGVMRRRQVTLQGLGECPARPECELQFLQSLGDMDRRWEERFGALERQVEETRAILLRDLERRGMSNQDSTPAGRGTLSIEYGPAKLRGKWWAIAVVVLLVAAIGGGSYVLAKWGRPTTTTFSQPRAK